MIEAFKTCRESLPVIWICRGCTRQYECVLYKERNDTSPRAVCRRCNKEIKGSEGTKKIPTQAVCADCFVEACAKGELIGMQGI